jgi:hypothetical protein
MMGLGVIHLAWELTAACSTAIVVTDIYQDTPLLWRIYQWTTCA